MSIKAILRRLKESGRVVSFAPIEAPGGSVQF